MCVSGGVTGIDPQQGLRFVIAYNSGTSSISHTHTSVAIVYTHSVQKSVTDDGAGMGEQPWQGLL